MCLPGRVKYIWKKKKKEKKRNTCFFFFKFRVEPVENFGSHRKTLKTLSFFLFFGNFYFSQNGEKKSERWRQFVIELKKIKVTEVRRTFAWLWLFKKKRSGLLFFFLIRIVNSSVAGFPFKRILLRGREGLSFFFCISLSQIPFVRILSICSSSSFQFKRLMNPSGITDIPPPRKFRKCFNRKTDTRRKLR